MHCFVPFLVLQSSKGEERAGCFTLSSCSVAISQVTECWSAVCDLWHFLIILTCFLVHQINCILACACICLSFWERSGSVVECLSRDGEAAGSSLTGVTALCP